MKNSYLPFLFVFGFAFSACNNSTTTNTPTTENVVIDTSEIVKQYIPETKPKGMVLSQKDIVMNDAVVISNDFYNNLKNQTYTGANKYMHPDALSITSVTQWTEIYKKAQTSKGRLGFVTMYDYGVKTNLESVNGKGDYAELIFDAQYKDGNMREKLTFFRNDSTESLKILAYQYDEIVANIFVTEIFR